MAFEDPEDLAGFFDPEEFGINALYRVNDAGAGVACIIILSKGMEAKAVFDVDAASETAFISVSSQSCPALSYGDSFEVVATGVRHFVNAEPVLELGGNIWKVAAPTN